jgi:hypothetical protein
MLHSRVIRLLVSHSGNYCHYFGDIKTIRNGQLIIHGCRRPSQRPQKLRVDEKSGTGPVDRRMEGRGGEGRKGNVFKEGQAKLHQQTP